MKNKTITIYELIGLIKDGKAPKKIKMGDDIWYFVKRDDGNYYIDKEKYCFHCCQLGFDYYIEENKLDTIVEILPKENDEWEDIEKLSYTLPSTHEKGKLINKDGNYNTLRKIDIVIFEKINQLIKNQKYLKEKLEEK